MILRIFRVQVQPGQLAAWQDKVEKYATPWLKYRHGSLAVYPGKPVRPDSREFCMIMWWKEVDSLKEAVGEDFTQVVLLGDEATLVE